MRTILYMLCLFVLVSCQPQPTVVEYIPADCERSPEAWMAGLEASPHEQTTEGTPKQTKTPTPKAKPHAIKQEDPQHKTTPDTPSQAAPKVEATSQEKTPELLDLNQASAAQLEQLPGIGPALAGRIVEYRQRRPFRSVSQLRYVKGIGPSKYSALHKLVTAQPTLAQGGAR